MKRTGLTRTPSTCTAPAPPAGIRKRSTPAAWSPTSATGRSAGSRWSRASPTRSEDKDDDGIWAVTCFCVRKRYRGRGITYPLARAAADFAREQGAIAVEGYAMVTEPGLEITWGEVHGVRYRPCRCGGAICIRARRERTTSAADPAFGGTYQEGWNARYGLPTPRTDVSNASRQGLWGRVRTASAASTCRTVASRHGRARFGALVDLM